MTARRPKAIRPSPRLRGTISKFLFPLRMTFLIAGAVLAFPPSSIALPSHRNIYQAKTGYAVSCVVCHNPKTGRLTDYGSEFLRQGRGRDALDALDVLDPDKDGFSSGAEIKARANPGDPRSTPEHPGPWLTAIQPTPIPRQILTEFFGKDAVFEVVEKPLSYEGVNRAERILKVPLFDDDIYPSIFVAREKMPDGSPGQILGRAAYATYGRNRVSVYLVVMSPGDVLFGVRGIKSVGDQRLMGLHYLQQFAGKDARGLDGVDCPPGTDDENYKLVGAVRRTMVVLQCAEGVAR